MPQYAIMRFAKQKGGMGALEAHHERTKAKYASNPDINTARSRHNFHIIAPQAHYRQEIDSRITASGCRTRKDSVRFIDTLITASSDFFKGKEREEISAYFKRATGFLARKIGRGNIFTAVVHLDEKTPHICVNKARKRGVCDGQSAYMSDRIDGAVDVIIREYLARIKTSAKTIALKKRYKTDIAEMKAHKREAEQKSKKRKKDLTLLTSEISKSLMGESAFTPDLLSMAVDNAKTELQEIEDKLVQLNYELDNSQGVIRKLNLYYEQFRGWAEEFEDASLEQRKMIVCQLVREINVSRGYELDIVLDLNYRRFLSACC